MNDPTDIYEKARIGTRTRKTVTRSYSPPINHIGKKCRKRKQRPIASRSSREKSENGEDFASSTQTLDILRQRHIADSRAFAENLSRQFNDEICANFYCPQFIKVACNCIQNYLQGSDETIKQKTRPLIELSKESQEISLARLQTEPSSFQMQSQLCSSKESKSNNFCLFVLEKRKFLRSHLKFCERGCQQILKYSNNFLHKRLRDYPETFRSEKVRKLSVDKIPVNEIGRCDCCRQKCSHLALTHGAKLQEWRNRYKVSQKEARVVLGEMLTPAGGSSTNCVKFIKMVTGASNQVIASVKSLMVSNQGLARLPIHKLIGRKSNSKRKNFQYRADAADTLNLSSSNCTSSSIQSKLKVHQVQVNQLSHRSAGGEACASISTSVLKEENAQDRVKTLLGVVMANCEESQIITVHSGADTDGAEITTAKLLSNGTTTDSLYFVQPPTFCEDTKEDDKEAFIRLTSLHDPQLEIMEEAPITNSTEQTLNLPADLL